MSAPHDNRVDPPRAGGERETLEAFLDYHRDTLMMKCAGLDDEQLRTRSVPPSSMSLLGLVRHLTDVERGWFRRVLAGEDAPPLYYDKGNPDGDFDGVDDADAAADLARYQQEVAACRDIAAAYEIDALSQGRHHRGHTFSLRWIYTHMLEEYARHNGHADLLRERIDGATGE